MVEITVLAIILAYGSDAVGKIHSVQYPELCLSGTTLAACNNSVSNQIWEHLLLVQLNSSVKVAVA